MYDHTGVMGFTYQGQTYFYQKDLQGNIVTIVNAAGAPMAQYYYDAWGNHKVYDGDYITEMTSPTFIGNLNPFRYRGYYYDTETKLYYLKSRYYVPEWCRWLSQDSVNYIDPDSADGLNLFAYCYNNPVMFVDPTGHSAVVIGILIGIVVGLILGLGYAAHKDRADNGEIDGSVGFKTYAGYGLLFAMMGGIIGAGIGYIWPAISAFVSSSFTIGGGLSVSGAVGATSGGIVITGGQMLAEVGVFVGASIIFMIPKHGTPNSRIVQGGSFGEYDSNGNLSYRVDTKGKAHFIKSKQDYYLPHIHKFTWKLVNGIWRYIEEILPFIK